LRPKKQSFRRERTARLRPKDGQSDQVKDYQFGVKPVWFPQKLFRTEIAFR